MIKTFILALALATPCPADDAPCLRQTILDLSDQNILLKQGLAIAEKIANEERARGDRWKDAAEKIAPKAPTWYESPGFWLGVGIAVGGAITIGVAVAVKPVVK